MHGLSHKLSNLKINQYFVKNQQFNKIRLFNNDQINQI